MLHDDQNPKHPDHSPAAHELRASSIQAPAPADLEMLGYEGAFPFLSACEEELEAC